MSDCCTETIVTLIKELKDYAYVDEDNEIDYKPHLDAINALRCFDKEILIPVVKVLFSSNDVEVVTTAIDMVGKFEINEVVPVLSELLITTSLDTSEGHRIVQELLEVLSSLKVKEVIPYIIPFVNCDTYTSVCAINALCSLHAKEVIPVLIEACKSDYYTKRIAAIRTLKHFHAVEASAVLVDVLQDYSDSRSLTASTLLQFKAVEVTPQLLQILKESSDAQLRSTVIELLCKLDVVHLLSNDDIQFLSTFLQKQEGFIIRNYKGKLLEQLQLVR